MSRYGFSPEDRKGILQTMRSRLEVRIKERDEAAQDVAAYETLIADLEGREAESQVCLVEGPKVIPPKDPGIRLFETPLDPFRGLGWSEPRRSLRERILAVLSMAPASESQVCALLPDANPDSISPYLSWMRDGGILTQEWRGAKYSVTPPGSFQARIVAEEAIRLGSISTKDIAKVLSLHNNAAREAIAVALRDGLIKKAPLYRYVPA